jgi:AraC family transcriptional regulator, ethanolamine operon transcriptional activator
MLKLDTPEKIKIGDTVIEDAEAQASLVLGADARYLQMSPGKYQGSLKWVDAPEMQIVRESQNQSLLKQGMLPKGICTVSFLSAQNSSARNGSQRMACDALVYLPEGADLDFQAEGETEVTAFVFDQQTFRSAALTFDEEYWSSRSADSAMGNSMELGNLSVLADLIFQRSSSASSGRSSISGQQQLLKLCLSSTLTALGNAQDALSGREKEVAHGRAYAIVRRARDFVEGQIGAPMTILDICQHMGVSRRTLQGSFEKVMQISPVKYLRIARLNQARDLLLQGAKSVGDTAFRCGFWHLSNFARDYLSLFGEKPSETLLRTRRRKPV